MLSELVFAIERHVDILRTKGGFKLMKGCNFLMVGNGQHLCRSFAYARGGRLSETVEQLEQRSQSLFQYRFLRGIYTACQPLRNFVDWDRVDD